MSASTPHRSILPESLGQADLKRAPSLLRAIRDALPRGQTLPEEAWARRHRVMLWVLWAHVVILPVFALLRGFSFGEAIGAVVPIALAGAAGSLQGLGRRARSVAVAIGLLTASAVLVNFWGGQIEGHFHFFVIIAILALYEDWLPFGVAIAYVVAEHGVLGAVSPDSVYNHGGNSWLWASIHGGFVLAAATANVISWRLNEDMRARMDAAHRRAEDTSRQFRLAFQGGVSGMALVSPEGRFLEVNPALCEMIGYSEAELTERDFQSVTHPDDLLADSSQHRALLEGAVDVYETEKRYLHNDGHVVWVQLGVTAVRDDAGQVEYFITQTYDVTERKQFEEELAHRALHDPLTELPNRALLLDRLGHALVRLRRQAGEIAVLFIDLDRFKLVNDGMGHGAGDAVLMETASRLAEAARTEDTVARFGGDEFTILCESAGEAEALMIAQRILDAFKRPFVFEGREFSLSVSVGIRIADLQAASPDALLRDADLALYTAKQRGRNRYELFDPATGMLGSDRLAAEQALRLALEKGELCLHYQPEVDLASNRIAAVEALVRWEHPERGLVPPGEFIPLAEESGLILPMGEWILREACFQLVAWRKAGVVDSGVRVAVNVSGRQLSDPDLPLTVAAALATSGLDAASLCLEITETAIIQDTATALANLETIKSHGVFIALDDFGVGFSSLSQIRELPPVDVIKVDRSFTAGLGRNDSDGAVVTAVLGLAESLGLTVVAEGVETASQLEHLRGLGCAVGQGFYFARPQPADEVAGLLAAGALPEATPAPDPHAVT